MKETATPLYLASNYHLTSHTGLSASRSTSVKDVNLRVKCHSLARLHHDSSTRDSTSNMGASFARASNHQVIPLNVTIITAGGRKMRFPRVDITIQVPVLARIYSETREILEERYPLMFVILMGNKRIHFDLSRDTLHFIGEKALRSFVMAYEFTRYDHHEWGSISSGLRNVVFHGGHGMGSDVNLLRHFPNLTRLAHELPLWLCNIDERLSGRLWYRDTGSLAVVSGSDTPFATCED
jgi:hypothetical protein